MSPDRATELTRRMHNLPAELTSFVGRGRELARLSSLLEAHRLVTLTGPGGCGKTRLARRVAAEVVDRFVDGVWLVELAALSEADLVPKAVSSALDIREVPPQRRSPSWATGSTEFRWRSSWRPRG
ncbi:MAG: AAA family ATPase [Pseudonocardia sp.]|nr:AAA family ATPase [Pseudonocardia sp.]MBO0874579.1 AAA family ATPase [Pseudonocardia sp.]